MANRWQPNDAAVSARGETTLRILVSVLYRPIDLHISVNPACGTQVTSVGAQWGVVYRTKELWHGLRAPQRCKSSSTV